MHVLILASLPYLFPPISMIPILNTIDEVRKAISVLSAKGQKVGFVPTMGALHEGHASLVRASAAQNDCTVVSIFVNPTQFGPNEDLDKYPRTFAADMALCEAAGATHVFAPTTEDIYPEGRETYELQMGLRSMDRVLDGVKRPGHFNGVLQVVAKLFNIVQPDRAYFGLKDFQQLTILKTMVRELFFPIEIVPCDIIREPDGLAMSSRNRYLNQEERQQSLFLSRALRMARDKAREGMPVDELQDLVSQMAKEYSLIRMEYFEVHSGIDLHAMDRIAAAQEPRGLIAAFCGSTRLIDNMALL